MITVETIKRRTPASALALGFVINLVVGCFDYVTGSDIGLSVFYLIPIILVVWLAGRTSGLFMAALALITMSVTDYASGKVFSSLFVEIWNGLVHLAFFVVIIILVSKLKADLEERSRLIGELQDAMAEVKTLSGLLPICAWCKNIRDDDGYWNKVESYIAKHTEAEFTHGICPECARKVYPELFDKDAKRSEEKTPQ
ncbi:MAG: hypothetical protein M0Z79_04895 [Nitrospiraceae bacterium]|nr:hypothetical protein [Nitrospiraceae bacterium]